MRTAKFPGHFKKVWLAACMLFQVLNLHAQFYNSGQDPASFRWKQINTSNFQIIFPADFEQQANHLANSLEYIYNQTALSYHQKLKKISIIIHSSSSTSNGFVTLAPRRMELFTTPPQDMDAQNWLDQLAVHELRHVVQIDKIDQGLAKIARILLGEQGWGFFAALAPQWFFEGDAVYNETALTNVGRGRNALFAMQMNALVTENDKLFTYDKMLLGSYKDFTPDRYRFGYPMVAYARNNFGDAPFNTALDFVSRRPYLIFPFKAGLKKETGLSSRKLYATTYNSIHDSLSARLNEHNGLDIFQWNKQLHKDYTDYRFPVFVNDSVIIALKTGMNDVDRFVYLHNNGKETHLYTLGYFTGNNLSFAGGYLVWDEDVPDIRWANRSFSCINVLDINTKLVRSTSGTRYFAPALSPDGTKIAAIEITENNDVNLVILDRNTLGVIGKVPSINRELLELPSWSRDGKSVFVIAVNDKGKNIVSYNIENQAWTVWLNGGYSNILWVTDAGDNIIFTADYSGVNNIYCLQKKDKSVRKYISPRFGYETPVYAANNGKLTYADYSSHGFDIVSTYTHPVDWENVDTSGLKQNPVVGFSPAATHFNMEDSVIPNRQFPSKPYSKVGNVLNIHSWAPFYLDYNNLSASNLIPEPGFTLVSQDKLGTCVASIGAAYSSGYWYLRPRVVYKGLFPVFDLSLNYGGSASFAYTSETDTVPVSSNRYIGTDALVYLPLNFSKGNHVTLFYPQVEWVHNNQYFYYPATKVYQSGMNYMYLGFTLYHYRQTSLRDLAPKCGFTFTGKYTFTPGDAVQFGDITYGKLRLYFPGFLNHHSLQISGGYQIQNTKRYLYTSRLAYPRGFEVGRTYELKTFSLDYMFPIWYPDFQMAPILYIKRVRGNLFFDYANNLDKQKGEQIISNIKSSGVELTTDFHLFRIMFPLNAGVRLYYPYTGQNMNAELIFGINLIYH